MYRKLTVILFILVTFKAWSADPASTPCQQHLNSPISNFCEVIPNTLWRGAKPDQEEATWLIKTGVKTIINLELLFDDLDTLNQVQAPYNGLYQIDYFRVRTWEPFYAFWQGQADEDVIQFLAIAKNAKPPIYVHCRAGENRTGVMIAAYKIILDNQTSPQQLADVLKDMQSYKGFWSDATTDYIKNLARRRNEILAKIKQVNIPTATTITYDK